MFLLFWKLILDSQKSEQRIRKLLSQEGRYYLKNYSKGSYCTLKTYSKRLSQFLFCLDKYSLNVEELNKYHLNTYLRRKGLVPQFAISIEISYEEVKLGLYLAVSVRYGDALGVLGWLELSLPHFLRSPRVFRRKWAYPWILVFALHLFWDYVFVVFMSSHDGNYGI